MAKFHYTDEIGLRRRELLRRGALLGSAVGAGGAVPALGGAATTDAGSCDEQVLFEEDFEDGTLDGWAVEQFRDTRHDEPFHVTESPAQGDYALRHATFSQQVTPAESLSLCPPLTFTVDVYVHGMSGITIDLQRDPETGETCSVRLRHNFNGEILDVLGTEQTESGDLERAAMDRTKSAGFRTDRWETLEITWSEDGTVAARLPSSGAEVSIGDVELSGHSFRLKGYQYDGWTAVDDVTITGCHTRCGCPEEGSRIVVEQGGETYEVEPVRYGDRSVEDFYDYRGIRASANTPTGLESGPETSKLFLYEDDQGPSLVLIHDDHNYPSSTGSGGRAVFDFEGFDGSWAVRDDPGDWDRSGSSPPETVVWQWNERNTDGGALRFASPDVEVTVTPDFQRGIHEWELLSGVDEAGNAEVAGTLDLTEPVSIRRGCGPLAKERPSDADIGSRAASGAGHRFEYGERGAESLVVDGTETLFHEFFALETSTGEVVTSYDEDAVTVVSEFEPTNQSPIPGQVSTLEVEIGGTTVEVEREVTVELDRPRVSVDYALRMAESQSALDLTLYTAADFDVAGPGGDVASYHDDGAFLYVEDAGDDVPQIVGIAADDEPDDHDLREYPAYEAVESGDLAGSDAFPDSGAGEGDAVAMLGFDLGTLRSGDLGRGPGSTLKTRQVRLGAAESVEDLWDVLDRRVDLSFEEPRLAQAVEDTRLVDEDPPGESTLRRIDDPPMVDGKRTVPLFDLSLDALDTLGSNDDLTLTVTTLAPSGTHPGRTMVDRLTETLDPSDLRDFQRNADPLEALVGLVPSFELSSGVTAVRLGLGTSDRMANGDRVTLEEGEDFETRSTDVLRIGFAPLEGPNGGSLMGQNFRSDYETLVEESVEFVEQQFPVPEVRAYRHDDVLPGSDHSDEDCAMVTDGDTARAALEDELPIDAADTVNGRGDIAEFDATLAVVPEDYFHHHTGRHWGGMEKGDPLAAALAEVRAGADTVAHEFGHHFADDPYAEWDQDPRERHPLAQRDDTQSDDFVLNDNNLRLEVDTDHARHTESTNYDNRPYQDDPGLVSRQVRIEGDTLGATMADAPPLMSYANSDEWIDAYQYNDLLANDVEPHPGESMDRDFDEDLAFLRCNPDEIDDVVIEALDAVPDYDEGDVTVEPLDASGEPLASHEVPSQTEVQADGSIEAGALDAVRVRIPWPEDAVSVRVTEDGESRTWNALVESLRSAVEALPAEAFVGPAEERRDALLNKLDAVERKMDAGAHRGAASQLRDDVRERVEQWVADDWSGTVRAPSEAELLELVDQRIADVEALVDAGQQGDAPGDASGA